ncbi:MAG TPA: hypothetical protein VJW75_01295 [Candidatus Eisenbacteria bacterium]|nr:hypothetical protein [Candidatus Eisenbacteria bacterium]
MARSSRITSRRSVAALFAAFTAAALIHATVPSLAIAEEDVEKRLQFHGYGEFHYNNPETGTMDQSATSSADVHRFVLGWTYEFTPAFRLDAEIDYEHAAREIELEYAHIDYDMSATMSLRVGSLLMPVGPLNEFHEPPLFYSVERPYVQRSIIPTTWQENGIGVVGRAAGGSLGYRAYLVTGLNAMNFTGAEGIREGRSGSSEAKAEDLAGVARLEYATTAGLSLGASGYYGGADQSEPGLGDVKVGMVALDARFRRGGIDLRGVFALDFLDGADSVAAVTLENVGEAMQGFYGEAAYDLLRRDAQPDSRRSLFLFARYERFDTNAEMPTGLTADPAFDREVITGGVSYLPIEKLSFKADFEHWEDGTEATLNRINLGAAFLF